MAESEYTLTLSNKRIYDFYKKNPGLDFESMNLVLLGFLEHLSQDMTQLMQNTAQGQIVQELKDIRQQVSALQADFCSKVAENNRSFLDTMKLVVATTGTENSERVLQVMSKHTDSYIDRLSVLLPKAQEETSRKMQAQLELVQKTIQCDLQQYLLAKSEQNLGDFISSFDSKLCTLQQPLFSMIQANQEYISSKIGNVKEDLLGSRAASERLNSEMSEFLHKFKASSQFKGQYSESMLGSLLTEMFPTATVDNTTAHAASGDFMLRRDPAQPVILIENKNYERNVDADEVKKFIRDVEQQRCSGIMLSQLSGIVSKPNFFIEINDQHVLVYLHYVHFSKEQIKIAVDIVDHLSARLCNVVATEREDGSYIQKETLDKINTEVQLFIKNKESMANYIRESQKKLLAHLDEIQLPELFKLIAEKYASAHNQVHECDQCRQSFSSKRGLASHKKAHVAR